MNQEIELYQGGNELSISRPPDVVLEEARRAAVALKGVIEKTNAVVVLGTSRHLKSEAWQTLGHFYGLAARTPDDKTRFVQYGDVRGFEATAELWNIAAQTMVSEATAMCLNDEEKWSKRTKYEWRGPKENRHRVAVGTEDVPLFQLRSMAQTRTVSRVHANALKWVVVLGGWSPTPAEEIEGQNDQEHRDSGRGKLPPDPALQFLPRTLDHVAPAGLTQFHSDAQVAQNHLRLDGKTETKGEIDDHQVKEVGYDMAENNAGVPGPQRPGR